MEAFKQELDDHVMEVILIPETWINLLVLRFYDLGPMQERLYKLWGFGWQRTSYPSE